MLGGCHHLKREPWGSLQELNFPWAEDSCWCCCVQLNSWTQATSVSSQKCLTLSEAYSLVSSDHEPSSHHPWLKKKSLWTTRVLLMGDLSGSRLVSGDAHH